MAELIFNPAGEYTEYFIVTRDGVAYSMPELGADLVVHLRGRLPGRSAPGGMEANLAVGADEEGTVVVHRFHPWGEATQPDGLVLFEGWVRGPDSALHAQGTLAFETLSAPVGTLRVW